MSMCGCLLAFQVHHFMPFCCYIKWFLLEMKSALLGKKYMASRLGMGTQDFYKGGDPSYKSWTENTFFCTANCSAEVVNLISCEKSSAHYVHLCILQHFLSWNFLAGILLKLFIFPTLSISPGYQENAFFLSLISGPPFLIAAFITERERMNGYSFYVVKMVGGPTLLDLRVSHTKVINLDCCRQCNAAGQKSVNLLFSARRIHLFHAMTDIRRSARKEFAICSRVCYKTGLATLSASYFWRQKVISFLATWLKM